MVGTRILKIDSEIENSLNFSKLFQLTFPIWMRKKAKKKTTRNSIVRNPDEDKQIMMYIDVRVEAPQFSCHPGVGAQCAVRHL